MSRSIYTRLQILISLFLTVLVGQTVCHLNTNNCNRCLDNGIACASRTQYYKCHDGKILTDLLYDCPENKVCAHKIKKCVNRSRLMPACPLTEVSSCGVCAKYNPKNREANDRKTSFACVGPNHFKICQDNMISNEITFNCQSGKICSILAFEETGQICVTKSVANARNYSASCLNTPKLLPIELERACLLFKSRTNLFVYNISNPYDFECESYLRCSRKDGFLKGRIEKCEQGFYDVLENKCTKGRPSVCGQTKVVPFTVTTSSLTDASFADESSTEASSTNSTLFTDFSSKKSFSTDPSFTESSSTEPSSTNSTTTHSSPIDSSSTESASTNSSMTYSSPIDSPLTELSSTNSSITPSSPTDSSSTESSSINSSMTHSSPTDSSSTVSSLTNLSLTNSSPRDSFTTESSSTNSSLTDSSSTTLPSTESPSIHASSTTSFMTESSSANSALIDSSSTAPSSADSFLINSAFKKFSTKYRLKSNESTSDAELSNTISN